jgi:asparagine synthase (glutamine-hydrolysing)
MLDQRLVEWANALPGSVKLAGGVNKSLLKALAEAWLPARIVHREKNGFAVPTGQWLMPGRPLWNRVQALSDPSSFAGGVTDPSVVRRLVDEHRGGVADHREALWSLIALDAWARAFLGPALRPERLPGAGVVSPGSAPTRRRGPASARDGSSAAPAGGPRGTPPGSRAG